MVRYFSIRACWTRRGLFVTLPIRTPNFFATPYWRPNFYATLPHRTIFAKLPFLKNITVKHLSYQNVYAFIERINFFNFWMFVFVREQLATKKLWPLHRLSWSGGGTRFLRTVKWALKNCEIEKGGKKSWEIVNWKEVVIWEKGLK